MDTRSQDTRQVLIEAALRCFAERGFDGTSLRMVASRARRPLSLIAHHFGGKEGLYLEVFRHLTSSPFASLGEDGGRVPQSRPEAIRLFRELIHALHAEVCPDDPARSELRAMGGRVFLMELRQPRAEVMELLQAQLRPWMDHLKACIRVLRPDLTEGEVILLGRTIMSQVTGLSLLDGASSAIWGTHALGAFRSAELLTEFSLQGLGVPLHTL